MQQIPLTAIPNQNFILRVERQAFEITLKESLGVMLFNLSKDGESIVTSMRCQAYTPLLPYSYLEKEIGNFHFETANNEYPHYSRFLSTDILFYVSPQELVAIRDKCKR